MGYPHHPGGYPPNQGGYQPYPVGPEAASNGATAITAGVLASVGAAGQILGGLVNVVVGAVGFHYVFGGAGDVTDSDWFRPLALTTGLFALVAGVLLAVGAIALFRRRMWSRVAIFVGCAITIAAGIAGTVVTLTLGRGDNHRSSVGAFGTGVGGVLALVFPVATAVLTLVPATVRWLRSRTAYPYPKPGYPLYPAYGAPYAGRPVPPVPFAATPAPVTWAAHEPPSSVPPPADFPPRPGS